MYGTYTGKKTGLASDDIAGIRSIYSANGPRTADAYNTGGASNGTLSTAASINSLISTSSLTALVPNLDIIDGRAIGVLLVHRAVRDGKHARARRPEQRPEPAVAQGDGVRLERLDRAGQRRRGGRVWDDAHGEPLERHRRREILRQGARGRHDADGYGPLCPGP